MEIKLEELMSLVKNTNTHSLCVGTNYLIRTVTMYYVGRLEQVTDLDLVLSHASWVADTGRFHNALKDGTLNEVEPFVNDVIISRGCIVDATEWNHSLPTEQK